MGKFYVICLVFRLHTNFLNSKILSYGKIEFLGKNIKIENNIWKSRETDLTNPILIQPTQKSKPFTPTSAHDNKSNLHSARLSQRGHHQHMTMFLEVLFQVFLSVALFLLMRDSRIVDASTLLLHEP